MSKQPVIRRRKITEYVPDPHNANAGTERGYAMLSRSIEETGAARSLVAASDGTIAAGNKTLQALVDAGIEDVIEVETDGKTAVVVKRTDWQSVDDPVARRYAYYDNRTSEVGLAWDADQILADVNAGIELPMFLDWELDKLLGSLPEGFDPEAAWRGMPEFEQNELKPYHTIHVHFHSEKALQEFARRIGQTVTVHTRYIHVPPLEELPEDSPWRRTGEDMDRWIVGEKGGDES
jgi:hypothetical protein